MRSAIFERVLLEAVSLREIRDSQNVRQKCVLPDFPGNFRISRENYNGEVCLKYKFSLRIIIFNIFNIYQYIYDSSDWIREKL